MELSLTPIGRRRSFDGAVEQLAELIHLGELKTGDRFPSERELAASMEISRRTLREAVALLAEAGVLEVKPGHAGGIFAATDHVPFDILRSKSEMRIGEVAGILEARRLLEPRVVQLAAVHARDEDFADLRSIIEQQKTIAKAGQDGTDRMFQLDTQFHLRIAQASGNPTLFTLMKTVYRELETAHHFALRGEADPDWVIDIHERTLDAIRSADHHHIEEVMDEHLAANERGWEEVSRRALIREIPEFLQPVAARAGQGQVDDGELD